MTISFIVLFWSNARVTHEYGNMTPQHFVTNDRYHPNGFYHNLTTQLSSYKLLLTD